MYYAVRKPTEAKGVYSSKEQFAKINSTYASKGLSSRKFTEQELEEALKWAGVSGIADAKQKVVPPGKPKKKEGSKNDLNLHYTELLKEYKDNGYYVAKITLINGSVITLTLEDHYYFAYNYNSNYCNRNHYEENRDNCWNNNRTYDYDQGKYIDNWTLNIDYLSNNYGNLLEKLEKSTIQINDVGLKIKNCTNDTIERKSIKFKKSNNRYDIYDNNPFVHSIDNIFIPFTSILHIKPSGNWVLNKGYIKDKDKTFKDACVKEYKKQLELRQYL